MRTILINSHNVIIISNTHVQIKSLKIINRDLYHEYIFRYIDNILWKIWGVTIGRDPNDQMLPIAYFVVKGETKDT